MSKQIKAKVRMQLPAGAANPAPPVGSSLGPHGLNLMKFCTEFNNATKEKKGEVVSIVVTIFIDKTFEILYKTAPVTSLIKQKLGLTKGVSKHKEGFVGKITRDQIRDIARIKLQDSIAADINSVMKSVEGSAKSMGLQVV